MKMLGHGIDWIPELVDLVFTYRIAGNVGEVLNLASLRDIAKFKARQILRYCITRMPSVSVVAKFNTRQ